MAGEIQLNSTTMATESSGSITAQLDTIRPNTTNGSLTLQGDSSDAGVTGLTIDSSGVVNTTTAKVTNIQATSGQSLTIKDEDGNAAITIGTDNTAASYLSLNFGSHNSGSGTLTANTLSDYEEGNFTPNIFGGTTTGTFSGSSNGIYTKIGNLVIASGYANVTGMTGAGVLRVSLPFTCATNTFGSLITYNLNWPHSGSLVLYAVGNQAYCEVLISQDDGVFTKVDVENAIWEIGYTATYQVQ